MLVNKSLRNYTDHIKAAKKHVFNTFITLRLLNIISDYVNCDTNDKKTIVGSPTIVSFHQGHFSNFTNIYN